LNQRPKEERGRRREELIFEGVMWYSNPYYKRGYGYE
jgi:endonuclease I